MKHDISLLQLSRSPKHFSMACEAWYEHWYEVIDFRDFIAYFKSMYIDDDLNSKWYEGCLGDCTTYFPCHSNGDESMNNAYKSVFTRLQATSIIIHVVDEPE